MVLKSGFSVRNNQMTSMLRWHSAFQAPARTNAVETAVDVKLQQVARSVPGSARRLRLDPPETRLDKIEPIDEGVDEPDRIVGTDIVVDRSGRRRSCERSNPEICAMPDSTETHTGQNPKAEFSNKLSHSLLDLCTIATNRAGLSLRSPSPRRMMGRYQRAKMVVVETSSEGKP
jgi:hypothetical protein